MINAVGISIGWTADKPKMQNECADYEVKYKTDKVEQPYSSTQTMFNDDKRARIQYKCSSSLIDKGGVICR